jgi:hypothetical protein
VAVWPCGSAGWRRAATGRLAGREWRFLSGGGGYSFGEWREIEASKLGSNRIEFFPLMLFERDFPKYEPARQIYSLNYFKP